ncbi:ribosome biosynthesis protein [Martiniozyma asiatica (nom. inval.)]|nr:ribosome biosynthesis protein [Martiniozyma asiatica]
MSKRSAEYDAGTNKRKTGDVMDVSESEYNPATDLGIEGEMEDLSGDDYESEGEIIELDADDDNLMNADDQNNLVERAQQEMNENNNGPELYLPHKSRPLGPDEVMEADPSVYEMLHNVNMPWPCMTLDILPDSFGSGRTKYPAKLYVATGTQAAKAKDNEIMVMKFSSLAKTLAKQEEEEDEEEDEDDDDQHYDPILENETIPIKTTVNRLRVNPWAAKTREYLSATMCENGEVCIFDISSQYKAFDTPGFVIPKQAKRPAHIIRNHGNVEGYGLDWSPTVDGNLLSGDCVGRVFLTSKNNSKFVTDKTPYQINDASIEDIQWSRSEQTVFATGGVDGYVRIWDTRSKKHKPALSVQASQSDVNVISWCDKIDYLLASGHDDGSWGVWDLRNFKPNSTPTPVVSYDFHKSPITSISFNPLDESIVAVSSEDNTVTLWDLAVEADDEEITQQREEHKDLNDIPPQLLFVHWQKDVKDVRWHRQIPGALVSTGTSGLNIWKTISV